MAFVRVPLDKGHEQKVAPVGAYKLVIKKVTSKDSKKNRPLVVCMLTFVDHPEYSPITHYLAMPVPGDPEDTVAVLARNVRRFCHCFDIPTSEEGFDTEDLPGAEGECPVTVELVEPDSGAPYETNRLDLPRVPEEA